MDVTSIAANVWVAYVVACLLFLMVEAARVWWQGMTLFLALSAVVFLLLNWST